MTATLDLLGRAIATWFGCGYFPVAPGTAGSFAALMIALYVHSRFTWQSSWFGLLALLLFAPAVWAAGRTAALSGSKDPGIVVVDEVVGQWITLAGATSLNWKSWIGAFVLFRLFDIWKPPPVRRLERLRGGLGIVADDAMAGVYGSLVLFAAGWCNLY